MNPFSYCEFVTKNRGQSIELVPQHIRPHIHTSSGSRLNGMKRTVALALCLASQADAFAPSSLGSISGVRPSRAVDSSVSLRMKVDGERQDRRSMLLRGAALALLPVSGAMPAAAQFGDIALPNLLGDPRGERPAGLGPVAVKRDEDGMVIRGFLSPCDSDNCVSTSDDVYRSGPWHFFRACACMYRRRPL